MATPSEIEKLERRWTDNPAGLMFAPLAEAYRKAGSTERALEILEVGLAVHPDYVPALIVRGRCHLDGGNLAEAEQTFQQVLATDPANLIALRGMADLCERDGRLSEAVERLELLTEVDPSHSEGRAALHRLKEEAARGGQGVAPEAMPPQAAAEMASDGSASQGSQFDIEKSSEALASGEEELTESHREALTWNPVPALRWNESPEAAAAEPVADPSPAEPTEAVAEPSLAAEPEPDLPVAQVSAESIAEPPQPEPASETDLAPWLAEAAPAAPTAELEEPSWTPAPEPVPEPAPDWSGTVAEFETVAESELEPPAESQTSAAAETEVDEAEGMAEAEVGAQPDGAAEPEAVAGLVMDLAGEPVLELPTPEPRPWEPDPMPEPAEVAPEPVVGESPVMEQPVPPESPEAAEVPWPGVDQPEPVVEADVEGPVAEAPMEPEPASAEPMLVVTESMAELFLKQGHRELALAVYRQLLSRSPDSSSLADAVALLEGQAGMMPADDESGARPSRAAVVTGGTPVEAMLRAVLACPPPAGASTVLPPAIEPAAEAPGQASQPLTLGQVFGDEPSVPPPAAESEPALPAEPSFDQFFGAPPAGVESPAPAGARPAEGDDMRQFSEWLKGLKR